MRKNKSDTFGSKENWKEGKTWGRKEVERIDKKGKGERKRLNLFMCWKGWDRNKAGLGEVIYASELD